RSAASAGARETSNRYCDPGATHEGGDLGVCLAYISCCYDVADRVVCPDRQFADDGAGHWYGSVHQHKKVERFVQEPFEEEIKKTGSKPGECGETAASLDEPAAWRELRRPTVPTDADRRLWRLSAVRLTAAESAADAYGGVLDLYRPVQIDVICLRPQLPVA